MAEARISVDQNEFMCPECLDLLKDPVAILCGHGYCKSCITGCCDQEDQKRVYSCPQCRQTFGTSPALAKNTMLAEVLEKVKKAKLPDCCTEYGDVQCDVCIRKNLKSHLLCLNSYCQTHLEQHNLTDTTGRLQEKHDKILEVFCRTDQKCICVLCKHKNHDTVSAAAQRTEKQSFKYLSSLPESTDVPKEELKKISDRVTFANILPWTRNDFLQYSHKLTLDLNTVNESLHLSVKNRVITYTEMEQPYPDHPDRFDYWEQVLCRESVSGRCYWEIEWSGVVFVSVTYKSIERKELDDEFLFGGNDQSWSLFCSSSRCSFYHNRIENVLPVVPRCCKIGVFVDHNAGTLSFYSVSDTMSLIHTVQTTFTQPLYPGFRVCYGSSVKLC